MFVYFAFFKISHIKYANMLSSYIFFSMATHIHRRNHNSSHKHIDSGSQYSHIFHMVLHNHFKWNTHNVWALVCVTIKKRQERWINKNYTSNSMLHKRLTKAYAYFIRKKEKNKEKWIQFVISDAKWNINQKSIILIYSNSLCVFVLKRMASFFLF